MVQIVRAVTIDCVGNKPCQIITPIVVNATNPAQCYNDADVCNLDIFRPNGTQFFDNATMTNKADCRYSNTSTKYNQTGLWSFAVSCLKDGDAGVYSGDVDIKTIKPFRIGNISCQYDRTPYLKVNAPLSDRERINWICNLGNSLGLSYSCNTYAYAYNENKPLLIQQNPIPKDVTGIGIIDSFTPEPEFEEIQILNVYFTNKDLRDNQTVTFSTRCQSNEFNQTISFTKNVTPSYKPYYETIDRTIYLQNNTGYIIGLFVLILIFGGLFVWIKKVSY